VRKLAPIGSTTAIQETEEKQSMGSMWEEEEKKDQEDAAKQSNSNSTGHPHHHEPIAYLRNDERAEDCQITQVNETFLNNSLNRCQWITCDRNGGFVDRKASGEQVGVMWVLRGKIHLNNFGIQPSRNAFWIELPRNLQYNRRHWNLVSHFGDLGEVALKFGQDYEVITATSSYATLGSIGNGYQNLPNGERSQFESVSIQVTVTLDPQACHVVSQTILDQQTCSPGFFGFPDVTTDAVTNTEGFPGGCLVTMDYVCSSHAEQDDNYFPSFLGNLDSQSCFLSSLGRQIVVGLSHPIITQRRLGSIHAAVMRSTRAELADDLHSYGMRVLAGLALTRTIADAETCTMPVRAILEMNYLIYVAAIVALAVLLKFLSLVTCSCCWCSGGNKKQPSTVIVPRNMWEAYQVGVCDGYGCGQMTMMNGSGNVTMTTKRRCGEPFQTSPPKSLAYGIEWGHDDDSIFCSYDHLGVTTRASKARGRPLR